MVKPIPWLVPDPPPRPRLRVEMQTVRQPGEPEQGEWMTFEKLDDLLGRYWDLGFQEGCEGRSHDTEAGDAQQTLSAIRQCVREMIAAERESVKKWQGLADASATLLSVVQARHKRELDAEREACAATCDAVARQNHEQYWPDASDAASQCAAAIRARGARLSNDGPCLHEFVVPRQTYFERGGIKIPAKVEDVCLVCGVSLG